MLGQILTIARNTFVESVRQPIYFVLVVLCGVLQLLNVWSAAFSLGYSDTAEVSADNKVLLDIGLATVFGCGALLAAFIATAVVSREIENRTVLTVVSKPVPRAAVVLGKYLGVAGAMLIAVATMLVFLLMGIRHGVMATAGDTLDGPVLLFTFGAVAIAFGAGAWGNFFYGWVFTQTVTMLLAPLMVVAWVLVLLISKSWGWQPITTDLKPQVTIAAACLLLAQLVLTALATAVSTRLGQVMTIVVCLSVFVFGLLSDYFLGSRAFRNDPVAVIRAAEPAGPTDEGFAGTGMTYRVELVARPDIGFRAGDAFFYGPNPNGFDMPVEAFTPFGGDVSDPDQFFRAGTAPAIVVTEASDLALTIRHVGARPLALRRPPERNDYVFREPTRVRPVMLALWSVFPNFQKFWLVDAVSQNNPVPGTHLGLVALYSGAQIVGLLALGVALFQRREVG